MDLSPDLDIPLSEDEVDKVIKQMSTGKAPGPDAIPAEVFKSGGLSLIHKLTAVFQLFWESETLRQKNLEIAQMSTHLQEKGQQAIV